MYWEYKEKCKTFSVPIKKEIKKTDKEGNAAVETISYKIKFIDNARFKVSSLSNLVGNLTEGIHKIKCKNCRCFLEYESVKYNLIKYEWLPCNKDYSNKLDEEWTKKFKNTFKISNNDIGKFIFLFRKDVSSYEYMDDWKKFNETTLPEKEELYSNLNIEGITDVDYRHGKRVCKDFELKRLGEYHDLYLKSDMLLLADVLKNVFRNLWTRSSEIYFRSRIGRQRALKKT